VQNPAYRGDAAVRRTRAVLFATVALTMLAVAPAVAPNSWVWSTLAWGHRPDGGKGANISGTLIDAAFSYTAPGISSARDWAEVGGGIRLPVWNTGAVTASVTASITPNQATTYVSRLGVVQAF